MIYRFINELWRRPTREVQDHFGMKKSTFRERVNHMVEEGSIVEQGLFLSAVDDTPDRDSPVIPDSCCQMSESELRVTSVHGTQSPGIPDTSLGDGPEMSPEEQVAYEAWASDLAEEHYQGYIQEHGEAPPGPYDGYMDACWLPVRMLRAAGKYVHQYRSYNQLVFRYKDAEDKNKVPLPWNGESYVAWRDISERLKCLRTYFIWWGADGAPILNKDDVDEFFHVFERYARRMKHNLLHDLEREYWVLVNSDFKLTQEEQSLMRSPHRRRPDKTVKKVEPVVALELCLTA